MAEKKPLIDYVICMACGMCEQACPLGCIALCKDDLDAYKKVYPALSPGKECSGCGICQKVCPVDAIQMKEAS